MVNTLLFLYQSFNGFNETGIDFIPSLSALIQALIVAPIETVLASFPLLITDCFIILSTSVASRQKEPEFEEAATILQTS